MNATITLTRPQQGAALVTLDGEVDLAALDQLEAALVLAARCAEVVVDAAGVDFIECCTLLPLLTCARALAAGGGRLRVCEPSPALARLIVWCALEEELATCPADRCPDLAARRARTDPRWPFAAAR